MEVKNSKGDTISLPAKCNSSKVSVEVQGGKVEGGEGDAVSYGAYVDYAASFETGEFKAVGRLR